MRTVPHSLSILLLVLLLGTLAGCASTSGPLENAAERGDSQTVRTLLDQGYREGLDDAFWHSACYGQTEVAQLLLERGANVNYVEPFTSFSALQCAAAEGDAPMVSLLLQAGANREYRGGSGGQTALEWAKEKGRASVVKLLEEVPAAPAATPPQRSRPAPSAESPPPPIY